MSFFRVGSLQVAIKVMGILLAGFLIASCSSSSGDGSSSGGGGSSPIGGGGVKGPLANADAAVYMVDTALPGFMGVSVDTGTTNASAALQGLSLPLPLNPPYILEITSRAETIDLTTGTFPVISTLRTVITQALLDTDAQIYATPLTTLAVDIAVLNANSNIPPYSGDPADPVTLQEFEAALVIAAGQVTSTLGFGLNAAVDIFDTPPLIDNTTISQAELEATASYRSAVEALTYVVNTMAGESSGNAGGIMAGLALDLADGVIDQQSGGAPIPVFLGVTPIDDPVYANPANFLIPGTAIPVSEVEQLLADETADTGATTDTTLLTDNTIVVVVQPANVIANIAPSADGQSVGTPEDTPLAITLTGSDADLDPLTYTGTPGGGPSNGVLTGVAPNLTYTPNANYHGADSFTFTANDGTTDSLPATVTITVTSVNDDPVANGQNVGTQEDAPIAITLTGSDVDPDPLAYTVTGGPSNGVLSGVAPNLTYSPNANYNGPDSFTFTVNDGTTDSLLATVNITVSPLIDAPAADNQSVGTQEDTPLAITLTGSDPDLDPLTYTVSPGSGPSNGVLTGAAPNLTYTPSANYHGADSFTFTVNDGVLDSFPATVNIIVASVNDDPVAGGQNVGTQEDTPLAITLTGSDADGDPLTYTVTSGPSNGVLSGFAPNLTYTPDANFNGPDSFTFTANDGTIDSVPATVNITVSPVGDVPVANGQNVGTQEDTPRAITLTGSDADGDPLTHSVTGGPSNGALTGVAPNLTYTPNTNYHGADSFSFTVNDGTTDSLPATVNITVTPVNDDPVANGQNVGTLEDTPLAITLTGSDVDLDPLAYTVTGGPSNGVLSGVAPNLTYTPNANFHGADSFTFTVNDGTTDSPQATVNITVTPVNDVPVANGQNVSTPVDTPLAMILTGSDVDGDPLTYSVTGGPGNGALSGVAPNLIYTPTAGFNGADSFTFTVNDGTIDSPPATVNITVGAPPGPVGEGIAAMEVGDVALADVKFTEGLALSATDIEAAIGLCMVDAANLWADPDLQAILPIFTTDGGATLLTQAEVAADLVGVPIPNNTNWAIQLSQVAVNATVLQDPAFDTTHAKLSHCIGLFEGVKASGFVGQSIGITGLNVNWDVADINAVLAQMYGARGAVDWSRAYNWATDVDGDGITDTDIATFTDASGSYQFRTIATDPAAVLNDPAFFTLQADGAVKLANALADFQQAASLEEQFLIAMDPVAHPGRATDQTHAFYYASPFENPIRWQQNLAGDLQSAIDVGAALSPIGRPDVLEQPDGTLAPGTIFGANAFTVPLTSAAFSTFGYNVSPDPILSKKHNQAVVGLLSTGLPVSAEVRIGQDWGDSTMAGILTGAFDLANSDDRRFPTNTILLKGAGGTGPMGVEGTMAYVGQQTFDPIIFGSVTSIQSIDLNTGIVGASVPLADPPGGWLNPWSGISVVSGSVRLEGNWQDPITFQWKNGVAIYNPASGALTSTIEWVLPAGIWVQAFTSAGAYDYMLIMDSFTFQVDLYKALIAPGTPTVTPTLVKSNVGWSFRPVGGDGTYLYGFDHLGAGGSVMFRMDASGNITVTSFDDYNGDGLSGWLEAFSGGNIYSIRSPFIDVYLSPAPAEFQ